jgi:cytochrome c biogenesis protein CcdA/thiol-disulfide isomerase/thioredoxin
MILFAVSYFAGMLTIVSPCILPVLPFVFARAEQPFLRSGLPMLVGMAFTFAGVATLAAIGGSWAVEANEYGRLAAIVLLAVFGVTLLVPGLAEWMSRPLVAAGARLSQSIGQGGPQRDAAVLPSFLLGIATGLLWAPCAGPILGLVLTGAALEGASAGTSLLLLAYAAGAATSLALALLAGGRVFAAMKRSLGAGEWIRRGLGAAVLVGVAAIALGLDTGFLTRISATTTAALEQQLLDRTGAAKSATVRSGADDRASSSVVTSDGPAMMTGAPAMMAPGRMDGAGSATMARGQADSALPVEGALPPLTGAVKWLNSPPLTAEGLRGKVVLVDFWTYSCINCLRSIPYVRAWAKKYHDQGLVVIGVHTPEFAFEKKIANVEKAIADLQIDYPVAIDNDFAIWRAFFNQYWPAHYFIDPKGQIRYHHFGEGEYERGEQVIRQLLAEAGQQPMPGEASVSVKASGAEAASDPTAVASPETYLGFARAANFISPGGLLQNVSHRYDAPPPKLNQWALSGKWTIGEEQAMLDGESGSIVYRFRARDLHLVLGAADPDKPVRFRVRIDGAMPGENHGADVAPDGSGTVTDHRLYQLVRQNGPIRDHTFEIEFLDPGVQAFAFTFG